MIERRLRSGVLSVALYSLSAYQMLLRISRLWCPKTERIRAAP